jgi:hypothetical protein
LSVALEHKRQIFGDIAGAPRGQRGPATPTK